MNSVKLQDIQSTSKNQFHFSTLVKNIYKYKNKGYNLIHNAIKRINYFRRNLTKQVNYLYIGNYKALMKETEEDTNK